MEKLLMNKELTQRLSRIDSPIASHLLNMTDVDDSSKTYVNYLGVSRDNPMFISYLDTNRIARLAGEKTTNTIKSWKSMRMDGPFLFSDFPENRKGKIKFLPSAKEIFQARYSLDFIDKEYDFVFYSCIGGSPSRLDNLIDAGILNTWEEIRDEIINIGGDWNLGSFDLVFHHGHQLYVSDLDYIEYIRPAETIVIEESYWSPTKRLHASAGKVLRKLLGSMFSDKDLESFVSQYKFQACKEIGSTGEFLYEEMSGDKIKWAYHEENYYIEGGELGNSCMRHAKCQSYFDIYVRNDDKISIGVLLKDSRVVARTILWYPSGKGSAGDKFYDRIYAVDDAAKTLLRAHLENSGYLNNYNISSCSKEMTSITLKYGKEEIDTFPYVDTMRYLIDKCLYKRQPHDNYHVILESQCGSFSESEVPEDEDEDDCCDNCGEHLHGEGCEIGGGRHLGEMYCSECCTYIERRSIYLPDSETAYDEIDREYIESSDAVTLADGTVTHEDNAILMHDGEFHEINDGRSVVEDVHGGNYYRDEIEEYCIEYNGEWYPFNHRNVERIGREYFHKDSKEYLEMKKQLEIPFEIVSQSTLIF